MNYFNPHRRGARLIEFLARSPVHFGLVSGSRQITPGISSYLSGSNASHQSFSGESGGVDRQVSVEDEGGGGDGRKQKSGSGKAPKIRDRSDYLSMMGEWYNYDKYVRRNDKLSNGEKAEEARRYADNFEIKGWDWYALEARQDAERYQRAADEEARRKEEQRARETEERQRRHERTCPSCHRANPDEKRVAPPWRYPDKQDADGEADDVQA